MLNHGTRDVNKTSVHSRIDGAALPLDYECDRYVAMFEADIRPLLTQVARLISKRCGQKCEVGFGVESSSYDRNGRVWAYGTADFRLENGNSYQIVAEVDGHAPPRHTINDLVREFDFDPTDETSVMATFVALAATVGDKLEEMPIPPARVR